MLHAVCRYFKQQPAASASQLTKGSSSRYKTRYIMRTQAEFEAAFSCKAPAGKRYFQHTKLADIVGAYPMTQGLDDQAAFEERQQRGSFLDFLLGILDLDPACRWSQPSIISLLPCCCCMRLDSCTSLLRVCTRCHVSWVLSSCHVFSLSVHLFCLRQTCDSQGQNLVLQNACCLISYSHCSNVFHKQQLKSYAVTGGALDRPCSILSSPELCSLDHSSQHQIPQCPSDPDQTMLQVAQLTVMLP